jgi:hypothetical protein
METLSYEYKPKALNMVLAGIFFVVCALCLFQEARTNQQGLIIDGLIRLDPHNATLFYWGLAACSVVMALISLPGLYRAMTSMQKLVLNETALRVPKSGLSNTIATVSYHNITGLSLVKTRSQRILIVKHNNGKANISQSMLPSSAIFEKICRTLNERMILARGDSHAPKSPVIRD